MDGAYLVIVAGAVYWLLSVNLCSVGSMGKLQ